MGSSCSSSSPSIEGHNERTRREEGGEHTHQWHKKRSTSRDQESVTSWDTAPYTSPLVPPKAGQQQIQGGYNGHSVEGEQEEGDELRWTSLGSTSTAPLNGTRRHSPVQHLHDNCATTSAADGGSGGISVDGDDNEMACAGCPLPSSGDVGGEAVGSSASSSRFSQHTSAAVYSRTSLPSSCTTSSKPCPQPTSSSNTPTTTTQCANLPGEGLSSSCGNPLLPPPATAAGPTQSHQTIRSHAEVHKTHPSTCIVTVSPPQPPPLAGFGTTSSGAAHHQQTRKQSSPRCSSTTMVSAMGTAGKNSSSSANSAGGFVVVPHLGSLSFDNTNSKQKQRVDENCSNATSKSPRRSSLSISGGDAGACSTKSMLLHASMTSSRQLPRSTNSSPFGSSTQTSADSNLTATIEELPRRHDNKRDRHSSSHNSGRLCQIGLRSPSVSSGGGGCALGESFTTLSADEPNLFPGFVFNLCGSFSQNDNSWAGQSTSVCSGDL